MLFLRLLNRHVPLRLVNMAGLSVVLALVLISSGYIQREFSWDRHNADADRIFRLTLAEPDRPVDGRIWGNMFDDGLRQVSGVEHIAKLYEVYRPEFGFEGRFILTDNKTFLVNGDFLHMFDIRMLEGDLQSISGSSGNVIISESLARKLAAMQNPRHGKAGNGPGSLLQSCLRSGNIDYHITGIFQDIPGTSHWKADVIGLLPDDMECFCYTYLLLQEGSDSKEVQREITDVVRSMTPENGQELQAGLMPLTDIHLHSHNLRELGVNGNIAYIWLIVGANVLLLVAVFFNLWLNTSLVFSYESSIYRLLRLHGAPRSEILKSEVLQASVIALSATAAGLLLRSLILWCSPVQCRMDLAGTAVIILLFIVAAVAVSIIPAVSNIAATGLFNSAENSRPSRLSYRNIRWMFSIQYAIVISVVILSAGMYRQMQMVEHIRTGGDGNDIMVMSGLTESYMEKYPLLRGKVAMNPLLKGMTTCFQIPGDAIRDHIEVRRGDSPDWVDLPVMMTGDGFLDFYRIPLLAGKGFSPLSYGLEEEVQMIMDYGGNRMVSGRTEEYVVNHSAMSALGFSSPEEAVGQPLEIRHGSLGYIDRGVIASVTDDYNYTGVYEQNIPLVMMHRNLFQFVLMVRLDSGRMEEASGALDEIWKEVYPDRESDFVLLSEIFHDQYRNEYNARNIMMIFTALCLMVTMLGLIVFMDFIIRCRTREIAIRKVNGASAFDIAWILNVNFIRYIAIAFIAAAPVSWLVLHTWLQRFAYKAGPDWWLFAGAGILVLLVSLLSVSLQSWHAASLSPAGSMRK